MAAGFPTILAILATSIAVLSTGASAEIRIGVAGPMGGQNGVFGAQMKAGAEAAVALVNEQGGINGEVLVLDVADDACDTRRALSVAQDFAARDVRFVAGHFCSGASIAAAKAYEDAGVVMISPSASHPNVTEQERWNVLRLAGRDDAQADMAAARIAVDHAGARIGLVSDGQSATRAVAARFKSLVPSATEIVIKPGAAEFSQALALVATAGLDTLYLAVSAADAGNLAAASAEAGMKLRFYGSDSLLAEAFWEKAGEAGEGALATFAIDPQTLANPFRLGQEFGAKGISPEGAALPTYAAIEAFVAAAGARSVNDGRAMADWLKGGNRVDTILGPVMFNAKGDVQGPRFTWYRWSNGQYAEEPAASASDK